MHRRLIFSGMVLIGVVCLFFIALSRRYNIEDDNFLQSMVWQEIEEHLNQQRLEIEKEMEGYPYEVSSGRNTSKLSDLVMETGGKPIRSVILSTWRSGSSFLGDLISAHPASYYTLEPLLGIFGISRLKSPLSSPKPLHILQSLFDCNFENLGEFLEYRKTETTWKSNDYNRYLKMICREIGNLCYNPEFATKFCSFFPFQAMKIVGMDLASMKYFLENKNWGVKLVYLVRDPRGVMNSRKDLDWCQVTPDCLDSAAFCSDILMDYNTAMEFSKKHSFKVLRYEDFSIDPNKMSQQIYSFYGMKYHEDVKKFLDAHTKVSHGNAYSTFRNTSSVVYQWKEQLRFHEVHEIQEHCHEAMRVWGYEVAIDRNHQKTFDPLKPLFTQEINYFG